MEQRDERIVLTGVFALLLLLNFRAGAIFWGLQPGLHIPLILIIVHSAVLVICGLLVWRRAATGRLAQYFWIAIGFYLLIFALCVPAAW
jgi:hypothetical protein